MHIRCDFDRCGLEVNGWCGLNSATEINECKYNNQKETMQKMAEYINTQDIEKDICDHKMSEKCIYECGVCIDCIIEYFGGK